MYCSRCGKEIDDKAVVCIHCGCQVVNPTIKQDDAPSGGFAVLGFFIPIVGLILYLVYNDTRPLRAKSAGKGALIGFVFNIIFTIIVVVLYVIGVGAIMSIMDDVANEKPAIIENYSQDKTEEILQSSLDVKIGDFVIAKNDYITETKLYITVKNISENKRSYFIKIEAVDKNGARLSTDMVYANDLKSGQEMHLEAFKYVDPEKIEVFRNASFKVLEITMY